VNLPDGSGCKRDRIDFTEYLIDWFSKFSFNHCLNGFEGFCLYLILKTSQFESDFTRQHIQAG